MTAWLLGAPINVPTNRLTSLTLTRAGETHVYALSLHERVAGQQSI